MPDLPTGTVTLLFTDMEGSTRLVQQLGERYAEVLADCRHLLRQEEQAAGETRFWLLQTLREFGLEQLARSEELESTRQAHAKYYLRLAEEAQPALQATEQGRWIARLEQEHENLRATLSWLLAQAREGSEHRTQQAERAVRFCAALSWFWSIRGYSREGQHFLEEALALGERVPAPVKAKAFYTAAHLAFLLDDLKQTEKLGSESLHLFRGLGDNVGTAEALFLLGSSAWARGEYTLARSQLEEAASLYQEMGEQWKRGRCLTQLARISTVQGEFEQAQELLEQCLALYRALGDKERLGWVLYLQARMLFLSERDMASAASLTRQSLSLLQEIDNPWVRAYPLVLLGQLTLQQNELAQARDLFEESRSTFKEVGDHGGMAEALIRLASVALRQGDLAAARGLYQESLLILQHIQDKELVPPCLEGLATVAAGQGELVWAAHLWGAAEALCETIGTPIPPVDRTSYQQTVAAARNQLGEEDFATAWVQGRSMSPEQAMVVRTTQQPTTGE